MLEKNIVTTRPAATKDTNPSTGYAYNYSYLPPLAMVNVVPPAEGFSARPDWVFLVARSALKILINSIMIGVKNKGDKDRKSTRLNSSHLGISYAVFCLKQKNG